MHESREVKLLRTEIKEIISVLIPEVEPDDNELVAIVEGEKEFNAGKYTDWSALKMKRASNV